MKFEFNGSKDKFLKELKFRIKESLKDYRYECPDDNHINIGFKRKRRMVLSQVLTENTWQVLYFKKSGYSSRISNILKIYMQSFT